MLEFLGSIWWLAVALGLLVTFHEFGHYWVARRMGVRVLRFSIGFGRPLWSRRNAEGTEFVVAAIPLGGYVKMLDEREAPVAPDQLSESFNQKTLGQRSAIVAAGPLFNFIFAVAAFWLMFMIGIPESRPLLGPTQGLAAEAGLEQEDLIRRVDGQDVQTWTHALLALIPAALDRQPTVIEAETIDAELKTVTLALDRLGDDFSEDNTLAGLGLSTWRLDFPPVIGEVRSGSAAERAGLMTGDRIVEINDQTVDGWLDIVQVVAESSAEQIVTQQLQIERGNRVLSIDVMPDDSDGRAVIGILPPEPGPRQQALMDRSFTLLRHGPVSALGQGFYETWRLTTATLGILGRMVTGKASIENLSGPITIARMANRSAELGLTRFLFFLGLISLSLAIINLLPIPMLDGGHLLYYLIEGIKGSPVSEQTQVAGQFIGLLLIAGLMGVAIFNDILRLFV